MQFVKALIDLDRVGLATLLHEWPIQGSPMVAVAAE
jgi:hypothetical protein